MKARNSPSEPIWMWATSVPCSSLFVLEETLISTLNSALVFQYVLEYVNTVDLLCPQVLYLWIQPTMDEIFFKEIEFCVSVEHVRTLSWHHSWNGKGSKLLAKHLHHVRYPMSTDSYSTYIGSTHILYKDLQHPRTELLKETKRYLEPMRDNCVSVS